MTPGKEELAIARILQSALRRLQSKGPGASLRSVATRAGFSHSYVSKIIRGEKRMPPKSFARLAKALQIDHHESVEIARLALSGIESREFASATGARVAARRRPAKFVAEYETFGDSDRWLLEEWHHIAIMNLVTTRDFIDSPEWIGRRLGVHPLKARRSLDRLVETGLLRRDARGRLARTTLKARFPTQRSHVAVRRYHAAMIHRAAQALEKQPTDDEFARRLITGVTLAANPAKIEEAKRIVERAVLQAAELLSTGPCTEVFQINLQVFPLTRPVR